jgi:hypothetical protein
VTVSITAPAKGFVRLEGQDATADGLRSPHDCRW